MYLHPQEEWLFCQRNKGRLTRVTPTTLPSNHQVTLWVLTEAIVSSFTAGESTLALRIFHARTIKQIHRHNHW